MCKIGENIRILRKLKNITQQQVAAQLDMTQGNYARLESGEIKISEGRLAVIGHVLGYSPEYIENFELEKMNNNSLLHSLSKDELFIEVYRDIIRKLERDIARLEKNQEIKNSILVEDVNT